MARSGSPLCGVVTHLEIANPLLALPDSVDGGSGANATDVGMPSSVTDIVCALPGAIEDAMSWLAESSLAPGGMMQVDAAHKTWSYVAMVLL